MDVGFSLENIRTTAHSWGEGEGISISYTKHQDFYENIMSHDDKKCFMNVRA